WRIGRISSMSGLALKQSAKRDSTRTEMRKPGNSSFRARIGEVSKRQSPIERRRMKRMRDCGARLRKRSLVFNLRFADQHDGDVVAYGIDAVALTALQALPAIHDLHRCLAKRTDENLQKFRVHSHRKGMVAR